MHLICMFLLYFLNFATCKLWPKGIVHYAINKKDYDVHSQDIIISTFDRIQKEVCVKFFASPVNYNATVDSKILYISNSEKTKNCPPQHYDFKGPIVEMPIGYKCLNPIDISRLVVGMLRDSIEPPQNPTINSYDLVTTFQGHEEDKTPSQFLLTASDRNYINSHYHEECGDLVQMAPVSRRAGGNVILNDDNEQYYRSKIWPLGIIMYGVENTLPEWRRNSTPEYIALRQAMRAIELASCVVFQEATKDDDLQPKNVVWFSLGNEGESLPNLGFTEGTQEVNLKSMVEGSPGHVAHVLNNLMRILGIPMVSNRIDRDNYISVTWKNVEKSKEHYLEKTPLEAWLHTTEGRVAYDFDSVTHAPVNYMCGDCSRGQQTVSPVQDVLWQRTLTMGHRTELSPTDIAILNLLYTEECNNRFVSKAK